MKNGCHQHLKEFEIGRRYEFRDQREQFSVVERVHGFHVATTHVYWARQLIEAATLRSAPFRVVV